MVQEIITAAEAKMIYDSADKRLDIVKPNGDYHNSNTLAVMMAYSKPDGSGAKAYDYITKIHIMIAHGYIETNRNPSRLTLTSKFKRLIK
jgi:hypothetical protein